MALPAAISYPIDAGAVRTRVMQWGLDGPVVLFVHGLGSNADIWRDVAPGIAASGFRCIAVDAPGHGLSDKGSGFSYDLAGHIGWLAACLDALGLRDVHLVGSSLGGLWASGFATHYPHRLRSLTLIGAVGLEPLTAERQKWTQDYLSHMDRESVAARLRAAVCDASLIDDTRVEQAFRMNNSPGAAEAFRAIGRYYVTRLNEDVQLERLIALGRSWPLLFIWGRQDSIVSYDRAAAAAARIPACAMLSLDAIRHVPHVERPTVVCWALTRHLSGRGLPAGPVDGGDVFLTPARDNSAAAHHAE